MLKIEGISKTFARGTVNEHKALDKLSITLEKGDFVTVIGSNGAGKSTLFNAICGSFLTDEGKIYLDGKNITYLREHKRAKAIGRVFQDPMKGTAPNMTIEENLALAYTRAHSGPLAPALTRKKHDLFREKLASYNMGLEDRMKTKVGLLSGGQRQVVTLLMCTIVMPKLLLLDEHTAALDPATAERIMEITQQVVRENGLTTMMITHNMKQALVTGNRTIMMDSGNIIFSLSEEERKNMTMESLLELYKEKKKEEFTTDRVLLS
ncbi:MAG: ATP-binding cassette domain-containing protein [Clostridia bacterium]|nr:ATP-binding cassette domain-containing protein [Clostridia bacterium]